MAKPKMDKVTRDALALPAINPADCMPEQMYNFAGQYGAPTCPTSGKFDAGIAEPYKGVEGVVAMIERCGKEKLVILANMFAFTNQTIMKALRENGVDIAMILNQPKTIARDKRARMIRDYNSLKCTLRTSEFTPDLMGRLVPLPTEKGIPDNYGLIDAVRFIGAHKHGSAFAENDPGGHYHLKCGVLAKRTSKGLEPVGYFTGSMNWTEGARNSIETFAVHWNSPQGSRYHFNMFQHFWSFSHPIVNPPVSSHSPFGYVAKPKKVPATKKVPACPHCKKSENQSPRYYMDAKEVKQGLWCHTCSALNKTL
jgi:hypothetical protein